MSRTGHRAGGIGVVALLVCAGTSASLARDPDDLKLRDRQPAYKGPPIVGLPMRDDEGSIREFSAENMTLLSWLQLSNFPGGSASAADCWGYTSPSGREYAIIGLERSTAFVEVTDPVNPVIVANIAGPTSLWKDNCVIGHYVYTCSEGGSGIQVIDVSNIDAGTVRFVKNKTQAGHSSTHTMLANPASGYLYLCGTNVNNGGLTAVSTTNPEDPLFAGAWTTRYVHECMPLTYTEGPYAGREIVFVFTGGEWSGGYGLEIVDATNKAAMVTIGRSQHYDVQFAHQGWITPDHKYMYVNDELDEGNTTSVIRTIIYDVSVLEKPRVAGEFTNGKPSIDHNLYVVGRHIFESNYRSGLRVFDATDPVAPVEVAYLDTYPGSDSPSFNGAWGNYTFPGSGTTIISDLERGLFVVDAHINRLNFVFPGGTPENLAPAVPTPVSVTVESTDGEGIVPGSVKMYVAVNGGTEQVVNLADAGGGTYAGDIPAQDCFDRVSYWFSAQGSSGNVFTSPENALGGARHTARVVSASSVVFDDNFETDKGWTVSNTSLTDGAWVRAIPNTHGDYGEPAHDADLSGRCWVTDNADGNSDVDGGPTRLVSPTIDLSAHPEAVLSYSRWLYNDDGDDALVVEVSADNGSTWTVIDSTAAPNKGGWRQKSVRLADFVSPTALFRVRFSVSDNPNNSVTEAAVDAVRITSYTCEEPDCVADFNDDGEVNSLDFIAFLNAFNAGDLAADMDGNGILNSVDVIIYLNEFNIGC